VIVWAAVCLLIPTIMRTKLPWYLNPFYPAFALGIGWTLARGLAHNATATPVRRWALVTTLALAALVAEAKVVWYSFQFRDVDRSVQGLLMAERSRVERGRIFRERWPHADAFVLQAIVRADGDVALGVHDFLRKSQPGDFFLAGPGLEQAGLSHVRSLGIHSLYTRTDDEVLGAPPGPPEPFDLTPDAGDRDARGS
jgi:hypothetical protein